MARAMKAGHRIETHPNLMPPKNPLRQARAMKEGHRIETVAISRRSGVKFRGARDEGGSPH